jgi:hypothetical protein
MSSFNGWIKLVIFFDRRSPALKLSRTPPKCNVFHWQYPAAHKDDKMTHPGQSGSKQLWDCVRMGKSVFFAPFFLIHVSQKKHYKYVQLSWPDNLYAWAISSGK